METVPQKKKFQMSSSYTVLFIIIIFVALLTWIIPAGQYKTDGAGNMIAHTYQKTKSNPQGLWDIFMAPITGMTGNETTSGAISISLFILVIGGFLGVVNKTNSLNLAINTVVKKYKMDPFLSKEKPSMPKVLQKESMR